MKANKKLFSLTIIFILCFGALSAIANIAYPVKAQTTYTTIADWEGASTATSEFSASSSLGAALSINTNPIYVSHGSQSLEISGLTNSFSYAYDQYNISSTDAVNQTFSIFFTSQLTANTGLTVYFAGETYDNFQVNLLRLADANYVWQVTSSEVNVNFNSTEFSLVLNVAYSVDFYVVNDPVNGALILQINGSPSINHLNINTGSGADKIISLRIEAANDAVNSGAGVVYYDYFQYISNVISQSTNAQSSGIFGVDEGVWNYLTLADFQTMQANHVNTFRINEYTSWWNSNLSSPDLNGVTKYTQPQYKQIKDWCTQCGINLEIMTGGTTFQPTEGWSQMKADIILNLGGQQTAYINAYGDLINKVHPWGIEIMNEPPQVSDTNFTGSYTNLQFAQAYQTFCYNAITAWRLIQPNITIIVNSAPNWNAEYFAQYPVITTNEYFTFHYYYAPEGAIPNNLSFLNGDSANYAFWTGNFTAANNLLAQVILNLIDVQPILNLGIPVFWEECGTNTADPNTQQFIDAAKNFTATYHMGILAHSWYYDNAGFLNSDWKTFNNVGQEWFTTFINPSPTPPNPTVTPTSTPENVNVVVQGGGTTSIFWYVMLIIIMVIFPMLSFAIWPIGIIGAIIGIFGIAFFSQTGLILISTLTDPSTNITTNSYVQFAPYYLGLLIALVFVDLFMPFVAKKHRS